jgi:subtilase family serine protease
MIMFSGTSQQVESALHTEIHQYVADGKSHFANAGDPAVPAAFSDVVMGFRGLNNFELKPRTLKQMNAKFTSSVSGNHYIAPPDFATIYDVNHLYQMGFTGSGQKIAVVGQSDVALSDIRAFRSNSGLPANDPTPVDPNNSAFVGLIVPGDADPKMQQGDIDEANLDVEWAGAIAYNATIIFIVGDPVNGGGVMDAINYAITTSPIPAPVISTSYGTCEANFPASAVSSLQSLMKQANAEGITVLAPTGDTGSADCDFNNSPTGPPITASTQGLGVDLPGALQSVTAVGGTKFNEGNGTYWKPAVGTDLISSATSYIPEEAWNDTNVMVNGTSVGLSAGGGGSSTVIPKPAWQAGTGVPNDGARDVPDVSFNSSLLHDGYLICDEKFDSSTNTFSPTCVSPFGFRDSAGGNLAVVGGTSVGPPIMAGIVALINQFTNHATGSGNINPVLYPLAASLPAVFHDVTTGNNQVPFSPPCVPSTQIGYTAAPGYDLATGLGSIDAFALVTNWSSVAPASTGNASTTVDFSLAFTPNQVTVKRGTCGSGTLTLTRLNGFDGTPSFTCTVPATLGTTTCAVVPAVTVAFNAPRNYQELGWWGVMALLFAGSAVAVVIRGCDGGREKSVWFTLVPGLAMVTVLALMIGCGGSSKSSTSSDPVVKYAFAVQVPATAPVASAAVNVTAAIGGINHAAQITVGIQ